MAEAPCPPDLREETTQQEGAPVTAPLPPCLLEGSVLSASLAARILSAKYADHLPYYRQAQILERRHGVEIARNTLCHWSAVCARWIEPLYRLIAADPAWANKHGGVTLAACWAHVCRKFHDAANHYPKKSAPMLDLIRRLFAIEAGLIQQRAGPDEVQAIRHRKSAPIIDSIKKQLLAASGCLPKSTLGKARIYALGLWSRLIIFLEDPRIPIHNNAVENAIRPTKLGAKNWLFIGRDDTGQNRAVIYTMVESIQHLQIGIQLGLGVTLTIQQTLPHSIQLFCVTLKFAPARFAALYPELRLYRYYEGMKGEDLSSSGAFARLNTRKSNAPNL